MEAEVSQDRPKALPATQNASQKSSGDKNKVTKFKSGQLILRKVIKIVAIRLKAKMHKKSARAPPQTPFRELTALPQTPSLDLRGLYF